MARAVLIAGLVVLAGCGGGSSAHRTPMRPARTHHETPQRVLTATDVDVLSSDGRAGFPGGCEQLRETLRASEDSHQLGEFRSGCATITIPIGEKPARRP